MPCPADDHVNEIKIAHFSIDFPIIVFDRREVFHSIALTHDVPCVTLRFLLFFLLYFHLFLFPFHDTINHIEQNILNLLQIVRFFLTSPDLLLHRLVKISHSTLTPPSLLIYFSVLEAVQIVTRRQLFEHL